MATAGGKPRERTVSATRRNLSEEKHFPNANNVGIWHRRRRRFQQTDPQQHQPDHVRVGGRSASPPAAARLPQLPAGRGQGGPSRQPRTSRHRSARARAPGPPRQPGPAPIAEADGRQQRLPPLRSPERPVLRARPRVCPTPPSPRAQAAVDGLAPRSARSGMRPTTTAYMAKLERMKAATRRRSGRLRPTGVLLRAGSGRRCDRPERTQGRGMGRDGCGGEEHGQDVPSPGDSLQPWEIAVVRGCAWNAIRTKRAAMNPTRAVAAASPMPVRLSGSVSRIERSAGR